MHRQPRIMVRMQHRIHHIHMLANAATGAMTHRIHNPYQLQEG